MNRKHYILGTLALLCLLGTGYYAWTLYDAHRKQVAEWNEDAKAAFEEALWMEVDKRSEIPVYHSSTNDGSVITLKEEVPDSIFVTAPMGRRGYKIEKDKFENSFIKDRKSRMLMGILLLENPLSVDTLAIHWDACLRNKNTPALSRIRYVFTDWNLQNDTVYSVTDNHLSMDSLTVKYLGIRCEHELVGYISYPSLVSGLSGGNWFGLLFPWIVLGFSGILYAPIRGFLPS